MTTDAPLPLPRRPSRSASLILGAGLVAVWLFVRNVVFGSFLFPLTYVLPLLVCVWTRDKLTLWGMALAFTLAHTASQLTWLAAAMPSGAAWPTYLVTLTNIFVAAVVVHRIIDLRAALEQSIASLHSANELIQTQKEELEAQNEELQAQAEELAQHNEELVQQSEELGRQNEEIENRSAEVDSLNQELRGREALLQGLLEAAQSARAEEEALQHVCQTALDLLGQPLAAVLICEPGGEDLVVRAAAAAGPLGAPAGTATAGPALESVRASRHPFARFVIAHGRTACVEDLNRRPDLAPPPGEMGHAWRSVIAAPLRARDKVIGALTAYSAEPREWSDQQFRLIDWFAVQAARIVELVRLQSELRRHAALVDLSADGILVRRLDGTITYWAEGASTLYGWSRAEAVGRRSHDLLAAEFSEPLPEIERRFLESGRWAGEIVHHTKAGRELVVESRWLAERGADGRIVAVLESNVDATARVRVRREIEESERRFRTMADGTPIMIWVTDEAGRIEFVNRAYCEFFGTSLERVRTSGWRPLVHPQDAPEYEGAFAAALRDRAAFHAEARVQRADGSWRWIESFGEPLFSAGGQFLGCAGSSPDVTDRKLAEEALRDSDRRKSEFLATLSHELRNPLAPIRYALDLLSHGNGGDSFPAEQARDVIGRQLAHLVRLVDDLLDVTRIASNKIQLRRRRVDLASIVQHALEAALPEIEAARHSLSVSLPPEPIWLEVDLERIAQALTNLLNNAAKFTDAGGRISLAARREGGEIVLSVSDTGIGLGAEDVGRVFDMFTQVGAPGRGGLGIGLALVRGVAELHGGSVSAASDGPGSGSVFVVRLPAPTTEPAPPLVRREARPAQAVRRRILVVDDNTDAAEMMKALLELHSHDVCVAYDGPSALARAAEFRPEVALLDIGLPGMDGYSLAHELRQQPATRNAFLIAVTGWGQEEDRRRARQAGFDAHLTKPADPAEIERLVSRAGEGPALAPD